MFDRKNACFFKPGFWLKELGYKNNDISVKHETVLLETYVRAISKSHVRFGKLFAKYTKLISLSKQNRFLILMLNSKYIRLKKTVL